MDLPGDRKLPDPVDVGRAQFETAKKGYDQGEVRSYLAEVAKGLGDYRELVKELERRIESLEAQLADAAAESEREITEAELTERLGTEAARVLNAAREGAEERRRSVEAELESERVAADDLVAAARDEAAAVIETARAEADRAAADRLAETEAELAERTLAVDVELAERRTAAEAEMAALVAQGEAARDEGRSAGRSMVAEAQVVRERILGDL
ncbi:MAG: DivIVA domain-containing protein, partial [Acidimicrobiia bacterium]|nr:DivIVA domain-containing protein [Acidimicrobiia bacterium]